MVPRRAGPQAFFFALVLALWSLTLPAFAQQAAADAGAPATGTWASELETLGKYLSQQKAASRCVERCYVLERLVLRGAVGGPISFELTGGVLAEGAVDVPLFGPPAGVRLEVDGTPSIGFEKDAYFLHTAERRFTLKGRIFLGADLALAIPGPLNTLEAALDGGTVVEGERLSGIVGATIHLRSKDEATEAAGPTVFQLSRAVRVAKEFTFEYLLVMRSGSDLGVVRLPLAYGEEVLDVAGATSFRVEGNELVLPTAGKKAEMRITGKLPKLGAFTPDVRSAYEWWLFESDPEHRIFVEGPSRQVDAGESPIARSQASARLYLVQKGQKVEVRSESLQSVDVLAAVVRQHQRMVVVTEQGDMVGDDTLGYENNGIDYLLYAPSARPIYLAIDGKAQRIMHQGDKTEEVLVPLLAGSHDVRLQSVGTASLGSFGGALAVPMPSYPLTASRVAVTIGVPVGVVPLALSGGDRVRFALDDGDLFALALGFLAGALAVRPAPDASPSRRRVLRLAGGLAVAALWFIAPALYGLALTVIVLLAVLLGLARALRGSGLVAAGVVVGGLVGLVGFASLLSLGARDSAPSRGYDVPASTRAPAPSGGKADFGRTGDLVAQTVEGGVIEGVTPVALNLPSYERSLSASRELVTKDRPFAPKLYYVGELALAPLYALWFAIVLYVFYVHRAFPRQTWSHLRERLRAAPPPPPAAGEAPPPAAA
jgi:hypothetical protein